MTAPGGSGSTSLHNFCALSSCPVNYHTGENIFSSQQLHVAGLNGMTQQRHYVSDATYFEGGFGPSWRDDTPRLLQSGTQLILVQGSRHRRSWTDAGGGIYTPDFFYKEDLTLTSDGSQFRLQDENGNFTYFTSFTNPNVLRRGKVVGMYDAYSANDGSNFTLQGHLYHSTYDHLMQRYQYEVVNYVIDATTRTHFDYFFYDTGLHTGKVYLVAQWTPALGTVRDAYHTYYDASGPNGPAGTLQRVLIRDPQAQAIETKYYRYDALDGQGRAPLRLVLEGRSYERAKAALGSDAAIDIATDPQLAPYADYQFTYDANLRVTQEVVQGQGTITFSAPTTSGFADGVNNWKQKVTETLPDGNQRIVYTNYLGQAMLSIFKQVSPALEWKTYYEHDAQGRVQMEATPSAVTGYDESLADLLGYVGTIIKHYVHISNSSGLLLYKTYSTTTTATTSTAGEVAGYVKQGWCRSGDGGTIGFPAPILVEDYTYIEHSAMFVGLARRIYPIASITRYENTNGTGARMTSLSYTWKTPTGASGPSNRIDQRTTTHPIVSTANNGSGSTTSNVAALDKWGRVEWTKDEDGFIAVTRYDRRSGAVTQTIRDVNTATTTDEPSGWVTPAGGGLHLTRNFEFDALGRTTGEQNENGTWTYTVFKDANWERRVYPGWTGTTTTGPTQVYRRDKPGSYDEALTTSIAPAFSGGKPTGGEVIDGATLNSTNWHSLTRAFTNSQNQASQTDSYFNLVGLTYTTGTSLGTLGTHLLRESYTYDVKGRREKTTDWTGTIRKNVHDSRNRVASQWVGTTDANLVKAMEYEYDAGGVGNGTLTKSKFMLSATTSLDTLYQYDFRNRETDSRTPTNVAVKQTYDNLDRVTVEETYASADFTYTAAELRAKRETKFDEKGQVYQTVVHHVDPATGAIGNRLTTKYWSNARGLPVKEESPNNLFQKTQFDGAGRVKVVFACSDPTESASYADALVVLGDAVIKETVPSYDAASNVIQTTFYERTNSNIFGGELSVGWDESRARRTYTATWYDIALRVTSFVDYGRNGGATFVRPGTPPAPNTSDAYLVTKYEYDAAGRQYRVTDNKARITERTFDSLSRVTKSVENRVDGTPTETELDTDRTTETVFDSSGRLSQLKAHNPKGSGAGVEIQATTYVYGTDANQATPGVWRSDILVAEIYPDSDDTYTPGNPAGSKLGNGTDATYDRVEYTYDYSSRKLTWKLPLTTLHTYNYDSVGRLLSDVATTLGSGVNGDVRRIEYAYDDLSRRLTVSSYSATSGGTLRNQVRFTYDGWGNELKCEQGHEGTATGAPSFQKTFADGAVGGEAKYARLASSTYPNGRVVYVNYPAPGALAVRDKLDRPDNISNDASGTLKFAQMTYLGTWSVVKRAHPQVTGGLNLDLGTGTGNPTGWDDLGRIDDQKWQNDSSVIKDQYQYGYDRTSNRTFRDNLTATAKDHYFTSNGLDQVGTGKQGDLNAGRTDITGTPAFQETWTLESHGNTRQLVQTTSGTTTLNQTRTHTKANEVTTIAATVGTNWGDGVLDRNGFMTRVPKPGNEGQRWRLTSDAWLRVMRVVNDTGGATIAEYKYDGLHRRTVKLKPNGANWDRRDYYYSCEWQVVEERELLNTASKTTVATVPKFQWVWGVTYIDEVVLRDENKDGDGDCVDGTDQRLYPTQDGNWNVTALVDTAGTVVERVLYDAYGKHALWNPAWSATQSSTLYTNEVLYAGYRLNPESGLYQVRNREYHPTLGRWVQRDPMGYDDGMNLYQYVSSSPASTVDPMGLGSKALEECIARCAPSMWWEATRACIEACRKKFAHLEGKYQVPEPTIGEGVKIVGHLLQGSGQAAVGAAAVTVLAPVAIPSAVLIYFCGDDESKRNVAIGVGGGLVGGVLAGGAVAPALLTAAPAVGVSETTGILYAQTLLVKAWYAGGTAGAITTATLLKIYEGLKRTLELRPDFPEHVRRAKMIADELLRRGVTPP